MRIIKRKKHKGEYFYLQHSYRKGSKVITREKYLGKTVPKNIEAMKKELEIDLYKRLEKISESFQKEWKTLQE